MKRAPKHTVESVNQFVQEKYGGRCLQINLRQSGKYHLPYGQFICAKGHTWDTFVTNVMKTNGTWCKLCRFYTLEDVQKSAQEHNGQCLSTEFITSHTPLEWQCENGHIWKQKYNHIQQGHWCGICSRENASSRIKQEDIEAIAVARGGKCLSKYEKYETPLRWECSEGHQWEARINSIKDRSAWCHDCRFKNESQCRTILEQLLGVPFKKHRPKWATNDEGNLLELDGYNLELKIAFEYNGIQHYDVREWFKQTPEILEKQKRHDHQKMEACIKNEVRLIVIPYTVNTIAKKSEFICAELTKMGQAFNRENLTLK